MDNYSRSNILELQKPRRKRARTRDRILLRIPASNLRTLRDCLTKLSIAAELATVIVGKAEMYGDAAAYQGVIDVFAALDAQLGK